MPEVEEKTYTLTQLNQSIENWVRDSFASRRFWIICQIAKINEKNGHHYLELVDSTNGTQTSKAKGVIWQSKFNDIEKDFETYGLESKSILKPGNELRIQVIIDFHKLYGLSLVINKVDSSAILGDIEKQKQETLKRLTKEGLLELQKRLYLGPICKRIALIGSPETNGFEDFYKELTQNDIYTNYKLKIFPVSVQGENAISEISNAILEASRYDVDAIALVRGGGSKMDLHIFNNYLICKAIAYCRVPVIVGVGHENDVSLADMVAYKGVRTPTAAAKYFYIKVGVFSASLTDVSKSIKLKIHEILSSSKDELRHYAHQVFSIVDGIIKDEKVALTEIFNDYKLFIASTISEENKKLVSTVTLIHSNTKDRIRNAFDLLNLRLSKLQLLFGEVIKNEWSDLTNIHTGIKSSARHFLLIDKPREIISVMDLFKIRVNYFLESTSENLKFIIKKITLIDPTKLFKNGYTISTIEGKDVNKYEGDFINKTLITYSENNTLESKITGIKHHKNDELGGRIFYPIL